jgi:uncharacterized protein (TIGR03437 family)
MSRYLVLAVLALRVAQAQAPAYTADSIVNASDYSSGPFAPNSVLSLFGSNLSWYTGAGTAPGAGGVVSGNLAGTAVYVDNYPAALLYASGSQINFVIPDNEIAGAVSVQVVRQGVLGPLVTVTLVNAAPALFALGTGFAVATHADGTLLTDASPAQPGEVVVIYATGLGITEPNGAPGEVPGGAALMQWFSSLTVSLNGVTVPSNLIEYAGVTPGWLGLYQINLQLPLNVAQDPTIQVTVGTQSSSATLQIAVH